MSGIRVCARTVTLVVATSALALGAPLQAAAAGNLEVSPTGSNYSQSYAGSLFDSIGAVVPGDRQTESLYLRNSGDEPGYLRVVLEQVTFDDRDFADALTVQTTVGAVAGPQTAVSLASPCWVLSEGMVLQPGASIRVDTLLALGNLDGRAGQGATATMSLGIALSDMTPGSLAPTDCGGSDVSVPVVDGPSAAAPQNPRNADVPSRTAPGVGAGVDSANESETQDQADSDEAASGPDGDLPVLNLPGGFTIDPNTWNLGEQWLVLILLGSLLGGGTWFAIAKRRRRDTDPSEGEATP